MAEEWGAGQELNQHGCRLAVGISLAAEQGLEHQETEALAGATTAGAVSLAAPVSMLSISMFRRHFPELDSGQATGKSEFLL